MMNRVPILIALFFFSSSVYPSFWAQSPHQVINNHTCTKKIKKTIYGEWKTSKNWIKDLSTDLKRVSFKSPTDKIGKWTYIKAAKNQFQAALHTPKQIIHATLEQ